MKESLAKAPKNFVIGSRDGKHDIKLPTDSWPYVSLGGVTSWIEDYKTRKHRDATKEDLAKIAKVADYMSGIDAIWPLVAVSDVPPHSGFVNELWICMQNTTKPIHGSAGSATLGVPDAKVQISLGELIAGGMKELKKRPPFTVLSCVIAPLSFEKGCVEAQVEYAKAGIPIISMSMSLGGSTCPATVAGTIVNANTENIASLVITQTSAPGAPHIYSSESTLVNPRTGFIQYRGVETPMIFVACAQMAERYGLPKMTGILGLDDRMPGKPLPFGEAVSYFLTAMSGTDLCSGFGDLDDDAGCSIERIVIDSYMWEDYRQYMRKFVIDEKQIALDVVKEVGQGNSFLINRHTMMNFKKETYFRDPIMQIYGQLAATESRREAHKVVEKILKDHEVPKLDKDILKQGNEIVKNYEKTQKS